MYGSDSRSSAIRVSEIYCLTLHIAAGSHAAVWLAWRRAMADLAVGRVPAIAQGVDHGVLEMGAAPPGDEAVGRAGPGLALSSGCSSALRSRFAYVRFSSFAKIG